MKAIGVIGAMKEEITALKAKMNIEETKEAAGSEYYIGSLQGRKTVLVKSGIGKVNAAVCAQALINLFDIGYIINIGVAGGIDKGLNIGDAVISDDAAHHDFDSVIFKIPVGTIPFMKESFFKADRYLIKLAKECAEAILGENRVLIGRIASGDQFIADRDLKEKIRKNLGAVCVEMEGAAIAHTAYLNGIPFVIIRAISDNADDNAHVSFDKFLEIAARNTSDIVEGVIKAI